MKHRTAIYVGYVLILGLFGFLPMVNAAPGDLDLTFSGDGKLTQGIGTGGGDVVNATLIQSDGKILVAGETSVGNRGLFAIARYNADGSLDTSFGDSGKKMFSVNADSSCNAAAIQPDGKIVMVGYSKKGSTNYDFAVARLNTDGSLDTTFDGDGILTTNFSSDDFAHAVAVQPDGNIVVIGVGGGTNYLLSLARYKPDGLLDTSFDGDGKVTTTIGSSGSYGYDVALQADGKIIVVGEADGKMAVFRYNTNGSLDVSFDGDGFALINFLAYSKGSTVVIQTDGKIVVAGITRETGSYHFALARLNPNGSLDTSFDGDGKATYQTANEFDRITESALQTDGKIVFVGYLRNGTTTDFMLLRCNTDGSLDTSFDGDGKVTTDISNTGNEAYGVAIQADGKIIAVGGIDNDSSIFYDYDFLIVRYNTNGSLDTSFDGDGNAMSSIGAFNSDANAVAIQPDGKIVVAGVSQSISRREFAVVRYNTDGTLDNSFDGDGVVITNIFQFSTANAVAIQPDGKIVVAGTARISGSRDDFALVRYNADGSLDTTFGLGGKVTTPILGFDDYLTDLELQPNGKILVGGYSHTDDSGNPNKDSVLARYNSDGSLDTTFSGDGKLTFQIGTISEVAEVLIQPDGKIVTVGSYKNSNGSSQFALVRFAANGDGDGAFGVGGIVTTSISNSRDSGDAAALQADGKIVVAGTNYGGSNYNIVLARYNPNGSLDTSFDGDGKVMTDVLGSYESTASVAIQSNGKILVAGKGSPGNEFSNDMLLVRYNANGSLDTSYGNGGNRTIDFVGGTNDWGYGMVLDSNGRAVVVGEANHSFAVARVLGDQAALLDAPFDFDGDGKTDISIFRPAQGEWWYLRSSDGGNRTFGFGNSADKLVPGDFTGDGKTDIAVWRPVTGEWFILRSEDGSYYSFPLGSSGDVPVPFDYDGDNKADAAVFRPSTATWYINKSTGGTQITTFGVSGDVPAVGDYDGDGKADIAIYRPSLGQWWIQRSSNTSVYTVTFGTSTDKPVQGDYTGDGKTDVAFWRPTTGEWFVLRSEDNSFYSVPFGVSGDSPAPGDYDGDGKFDIAVFRPSSSTWYINRSTAGILITTFGISGDNPVPSVFVP